MSTIWKRLNDHGKYWRHVYKVCSVVSNSSIKNFQGLLLIDYLLKNGSEQVIRECRDNIIQIQTLTEFQHIEEDQDKGLSGEFFSVSCSKNEALLFFNDFNFLRSVHF